nr:MAG TPA: hypothetical protein [Caudoviricetes sp.]
MRNKGFNLSTNLFLMSRSSNFKSFATLKLWQRINVKTK